jgi:hypothetical protein
VSPAQRFCMKMLGGWISSRDEAALSEHCWGTHHRPLPVLLMRGADNCTQAEWTGICNLTLTLITTQQSLVRVDSHPYDAAEAIKAEGVSAQKRTRRPTQGVFVAANWIPSRVHWPGVLPGLERLLR